MAYIADGFLGHVDTAVAITRFDNYWVTYPFQIEVRRRGPLWRQNSGFFPNHLHVHFTVAEIFDPNLVPFGG